MPLPVEIRPTLITPIVTVSEPAQTRILRKPKLEIATTNRDKLKEFESLFASFDVVGIALKVHEIQSRDPEEVVSRKAIEAFIENGFNPILVEDTSLDIPAIARDKIPTFVKFWADTPEDREKVCEELTEKGKSREAMANVYLAIYDGTEVHIRRGQTSGKIARKPSGSRLFGWDDIFIPDNQVDGRRRTFAQMSLDEKNRYSMRRKAVDDWNDNPVQIGRWTIQLQEPYDDEMLTIREEELATSEQTLNFAFALESLEGIVDPNADFEIPVDTNPVNFEHNEFYTRYTSSDTPSIGIILTNIDEDRVEINKNGYPVIYQMGPERKKLAVAQRALFFNENQSPVIQSRIKAIENGDIQIPERPNQMHPVVEELLGIKRASLLRRIFTTKRKRSEWYATHGPSFKDFSYVEQSSDRNMSRDYAIENGTMIHKIGKYPREPIGLGSLVPVSGQRDVVVMGALGNMLTFIPRNSLFAENVDRQIELVKEVKKTINSIGLSQAQIEIAERNIGVALGSGNPESELEKAKRLYHEAGVKLFRIYTINSGPNVIETARLIREYFDSIGEDVEIAVGQIADKKQAERLIEDDIRADMLVFGHGAGRQCVSAENGMAINTVELVYSMTTDKRFNKTSILVEGGVSEHTAIPILMGVDGVLYNQQLVRGTIESSDLFVRDKKSGKMGQPYQGSASAPTAKIEASNPKLTKLRIDASGRVKKPEGKTGIMFGEKKAPTAAFYIKRFKMFISRMLVDLGVSSIEELRTYLDSLPEKSDIFRIPTPDTKELSGDYFKKTA